MKEIKMSEWQNSNSFDHNVLSHPLVPFLARGVFSILIIDFYSLNFLILAWCLVLKSDVDISIALQASFFHLIEMHS